MGNLVPHCGISCLLLYQIFVLNCAFVIKLGGILCFVVYIMFFDSIHMISFICKV
jgi:hypothetical protein